MGNKIRTESKQGERGISCVSCASERLTLITANHQAPVVFFISHWPYVEISSKSCRKSWLSASNLSTMLMRILSFKNRGFPDSSVGKESACNAGDPGLIPESGRSAGEGIGYPLQYPGLENSMDCIVCGVSKSRTQLSDFHFLTFKLAGQWHVIS